MKKEFKIISQLIENNTRVLDVGCGDGTLMKHLKDNKNIDTRGLEISKNNVQTCIGKGLAVIEGNAEKDLQQFPNLSFDYVVLSQTLQAFYNPEKVINDLLSVANKAIVTIPNFGYWKVRLQLLFKGTMPITKNLPNEWYISHLSSFRSVMQSPLTDRKGKTEIVATHFGQTRQPVTILI